jgi:hypothetical protein
MQINWFLIGICALIWLAGYCFGYSVGKTSGLKEGAFFILNKIEETVDKLLKEKEGFDYEHKKGD